jgi:integrase
MTQGDIHNRSRTLERIQNQIETSPDISERDKKLLLEGTSDFPGFLTFLQNDPMSDSRINRYLRTWKRFCKYTDWDIEEVDKTKIAKLVGDLSSDKITKSSGKPFASATKRELKKGIRKMYIDYVETYRNELDVGNDFRGEELINFDLAIDKNYTDSDRLPTPKTVKSLVENANKIRNKAYIMLLWSTGGRNGEILGLKWQDVDFSSKVGKVTFRETKTGGDHQVPMAEAYPFMKQHLENDPKSSEGDAFVFRSVQSDTQLSGAGGANIITRTREDTDIASKIKTNPHAFRKGRTVFWIKEKQNEAWICKHMNWDPGTDVVAHYARVDDEAVENEVSRHLGLEENGEREESNMLTPAECHECRTINSFTSDICRSCGEALATGELVEEFEIQETKSELKNKMIEQNIGLDDEELEEEARRLVEENLGR